MFTAGSQLFYFIFFVHVKVKAQWSSSPGCFTVLHITKNYLNVVVVVNDCNSEI
jgi:hypothetical protein